MASVATTRNRLNKQGTGDNTGTWGSVLNTQALDLVDEALDGVSAIAVAGNVTLSSANYSTDEARKRVLKLTGSPGASYTITIPSVEKWYIIHNATNAPQTIKAGGLGVSVSSASMTTIYCDGTDCFAPAQAVPTAIGAVTDFAGYRRSGRLAALLWAGHQSRDLCCVVWRDRHGLRDRGWYEHVQCSGLPGARHSGRRQYRRDSGGSSDGLLSSDELRAGRKRTPSTFRKCRSTVTALATRLTRTLSVIQGTRTPTLKLSPHPRPRLAAAAARL
jgi:hypothetical protein